MHTYPYVQNFLNNFVEYFWLVKCLYTHIMKESKRWVKQKWWEAFQEIYYNNKFD